MDLNSLDVEDMKKVSLISKFSYDAGQWFHTGDSSSLGAFESWNWIYSKTQSLEASKNHDATEQ
jgi:hypothetical protein